MKFTLSVLLLAASVAAAPVDKRQGYGSYGDYGEWTCFSVSSLVLCYLHLNCLLTCLLPGSYGGVTAPTPVPAPAGGYGLVYSDANNTFSY